MRIENTTSLSTIRGTKSRSKTNNTGSQFSLSEETSDVEAGATALPANVSSLDGLLTLQSVDDATNGKKHVAERGFDLLDLLEEMRLGLLTGRLSSAQVTRIAHKIRKLGRTGDRNLDSILSDIDMRARVELAKLGIFDI